MWQASWDRHSAKKQKGKEKNDIIEIYERYMVGEIGYNEAVERLKEIEKAEGISQKVLIESIRTRRQIDAKERWNQEGEVERIKRALTILEEGE